MFLWTIMTDPYIVHSFDWKTVLQLMKFVIPLGCFSLYCSMYSGVQLYSNKARGTMMLCAFIIALHRYLRQQGKRK